MGNPLMEIASELSKISSLAADMSVMKTELENLKTENQELRRGLEDLRVSYGDINNIHIPVINSDIIHLNAMIESAFSIIESASAINFFHSIQRVRVGPRGIHCGRMKKIELVDLAKDMSKSREERIAQNLAYGNFPKVEPYHSYDTINEKIKTICQENLDPGMDVISAIL